MIIVCAELPQSVAFTINIKEDVLIINSLVLEEVVIHDGRTVKEILAEMRSQGLRRRYHKELSYKLIDLPEVAGG